MAQLVGLLKFIGTLGNITSVRTKEGSYIKMKNLVPKYKYQHSASYADFRMHGQYMRTASQLSRSFRVLGGLYLRAGSNSRMYSRLNALLLRLIQCDPVSRKGEFRAELGVQTDEGKALLLDFEFNKFLSFGTVFKSHYTLSDDLKTIAIQSFNPKYNLLQPKGATHVQLQTALLRFDFGSGAGQFVKGTPVLMPLKDATVDLSLVCALPDSGPGTLLSFLQVTFFQELNGQPYALKGDEGTVVTVMGVVNDE
ncbi:hypothetical protein [Flavobacterium sp. XGLA_31]|uniref:hypothetical protein n=1 Tax=Flavobacterium sp. XGLA_31 TaxID=3447666 RepID=UPI003F32EA67